VKGLRQLLHEGHAADTEALATLSPYQTEHINRFGNYALNPSRTPEPLEQHLGIPPAWIPADKITPFLAFLGDAGGALALGSPSRRQWWPKRSLRPIGLAPGRQARNRFGPRFLRPPEVPAQPLESDGSASVAGEHRRPTDTGCAFQRVRRNAGDDWRRPGRVHGQGSGHRC
jgi:Tn3 transposase DDE domain